ncbi:hypothetical protein [Hyphomicrobium sp.]|uniref:hypothetical protein n=1 Tax=Hyphomicrobium sp. TaxID=82 RepID=UPI001D3A21A6|nr:hypothetical protein [Hyphomicrobium sp.]MBY0561540.1 hypothetical protein [Hyphomicrobium sp.]
MYITAAEVQVKRETLAAVFKGWKFALRLSPDNRTLTVSVVEAPYDYGFDGRKPCYDVDTEHLAEQFDGAMLKALERVLMIAAGNSHLTKLEIGHWLNRPFKYRPAIPAQAKAA